MAKRIVGKRYLLCVKNDSYPVSLEVRKIYARIPDAVAESRGFVRVIDESGEDYLFPNNCFIAVELPKAAMAAMLEAS